MNQHRIEIKRPEASQLPPGQALDPYIIMECKELEVNLARCSCTYEPCSRKGRCCECIAYHIRNRQLPACAFPPEAEKTYNRSFGAFVAAVGRK